MILLFDEMSKLVNEKFTEYMTASLKRLGYRRFRKLSLARITDGELLQVVNLQMHSGNFTINFYIDPLFIPKYQGGVRMGGGMRIGDLMQTGDIWWPCHDPTLLDAGFTAARDGILRNGVPYFDRVWDAETLAGPYAPRDDPRQRCLPYPEFDGPTEALLLARINRRDLSRWVIERYDEVMTRYLEKMRASMPRKYKGAIEDLREEERRILSLVEGPQDELSAYFSETLRSRLEELNMEKWTRHSEGKHRAI